MPILTLNDLFAALFRPAAGEGPVIRQPQRPLREALFEMFFPDALVRQFADKSKSNLTWFFTSDARNKSVRRALVALLRQEPLPAIEDAYRKCRQVLWPRAGHPVFDAAALKAVLDEIQVPAPLDAQLGITRPGSRGEPSLLDRFYGADEAAALSRMILTLAVAGDAPGDAMAGLWRADAAGAGDFMAADDSVEGTIRRCRMLDLRGLHEQAFEGFEAVARRLGRPAETADESMLYCRLGEMLFNGEGCGRDEKAARAYDRLGCLDANPRSWHQLSLHISGSEARQALERAAELGYGPAIRQLGMAWYNGSARLACARSVDSARRWFRRGMTVPGPDGAACAFMLGQLQEALGERDVAMNAYRVAQENGSAEAAQRLSRLDWALPAEPVAPSEPKGAAGASRGYCLANGLEGCNRIFLEGLEGRWDVTACCSASDARPPQGARLTEDAPEVALRRLAQGVYWGGAPRFPALVIALMSDDRRRNLFQAVALLGELQRMAEALGDRAWDLADQVDMYVLADHDDGALLDSAFAGMGELYFRVRLCDPAMDAADRLFSAAPLFLPRLRAAEDAPVRLKLVGCGEAAMALLLRAVALPLPEAAALTVDVFGEGAGAMERRFYQRCPGLRGPGAALCAALPRFHDCVPEEDMAGAMDGPGGLGEGNYFVVAAGNDGRNLRLGALLRGELLRRCLEAERQPFIAVHTAHPVARWLAGSLSAGADFQAAPWCSQYDLYPFGALDMYAPARLEGDALERRARQAHMLYIGLPDTRDARHAAMGGYYRRQLARDTARLTALGLAYRMHLAGLSLPGWRLYGVGGEEARLGRAYIQWLKAEEHLQAALRDEHTRRCRGLLALGWSPATAEQVSAYVLRGNPGHRLYPARLDPFLCPWEVLEDGELLREVRRIVRARFPEKSVPDPRRDEEASLRDTERILGE